MPVYVIPVSHTKDSQRGLWDYLPPKRLAGE